MIYSRKTTLVCYTMITAILILMLLGCGGGPKTSGSDGTGSSDAIARAASTSTSALNLNTYNNWHFTNDQGWTKAGMLSVLAKKRDIMSSEFMGFTPSELKALNPSARVYRYYMLSAKVTASWETSTNMQTPLTTAVINDNNWWLRDGNGNIVKENSWIALLDVGKPGFKEAYLSSILSRLSGKGVDGVVFDYNCIDMISKYIKGPGLAANPTYADDAAWFNKAWQPFLSYVLSGLKSAGYRVIGNCAGAYGTTSSYAQFQRSLYDGVVYEQWAVGWGGEWLSGSTILSRIASFKDDPLEAWTADFGAVTSDSLFQQKLQVSLAMYYIAVPTSAYARRSFGICGNGDVQWYGIWDMNIGTPAASAQRMATKYAWRRKFTKGMVLLNYESSSTVSFTLDGRYKDVNGKVYNGIANVPAHTGLILTK